VGVAPLSPGRKYASGIPALELMQKILPGESAANEFRERVLTGQPVSEYHWYAACRIAMQESGRLLTRRMDRCGNVATNRPQAVFVEAAGMLAAAAALLFVYKLS